jgi:hypothetical protein
MDNRRIALITETYQPEINGVANTLAYWVGGIKNHGIHIDIFRPKQGRNDANTRARLENQYTVKGYPIPGYKELRFGLPQSNLFKNCGASNGLTPYTSQPRVHWVIRL